MGSALNEQLNEQQVWAEWRKRLGVRDAGYLRRLWSDLKAKGIVRDACNGELEMEYLVWFSKTSLECLLKPEEGTPPEGREDSSQAQGEAPKRDAVQASLSPLESERQAALEEYLAMCAACDSGVYSFRKKVLKGGLLAAEEALGLVLSPAAAILDIREFEDWEIPVVGHSAVLKNRSTKQTAIGETYSATIQVDPPGREVPKSVPVLYGSSGGWSPSILRFPGKEGEIEAVRIWGKSLLDELRVIGDGLSRSYRWHPAHAARFVLTGKVPSVPALVVEREFYRSRYHQDHVIRIEAPPWVSTETIKNAFHRAREKSLGAPPGTLKGKSLALLRFVTERTNPTGLLEEGARIPDPGGWFDGLTDEEIEPELVAEQAYMKAPEDRELLKEWNALYSSQGWGYKEVRLFRRDYNRIRKAVAYGPPYQI